MHHQKKGQLRYGGRDNRTSFSSSRASVWFKLEEQVPADNLVLSLLCGHPRSCEPSFAYYEIKVFPLGLPCYLAEKHSFLVVSTAPEAQAYAWSSSAGELAPQNIPSADKTGSGSSIVKALGLVEMNKLIVTKSGEPSHS